MTIRSSRFVGIIITALVLGGAYAYYREAPGERARGSSTELLQRGGQIVGTMRSQPSSFNRLVVADQTSATVAMLLHAPLVRRNRATFEIEPWLAERWESSNDGLTHTLHLRQGLTWSDGTPFTSADVLFTIQAALDPRTASVFAGTLAPGGTPIAAAAPDANTVVLTYAAPAGPGVGLIEGLPILPRHKLEASFANSPRASAWCSTATRATSARPARESPFPTSTASSSKWCRARTRSCCA